MSRQSRKFLIPLSVFLVTVLAVYLIFKFPPKRPEDKVYKAPEILVDTITLKPVPHTFMLESYGTVRPHTESALISQVSGQVVNVSDKFRNGGFFSQGNEILRIDDRDYRANMKIAEAAQVLAKKEKLEEEERGKQALEDWERIGKGEKPNKLVLRIPQLEAAQGKVLSTEAQLARAKLDLERCRILAPYDGRILKKHVDIGQVVSSNSLLAQIYATNKIEVRLPITNRDLPFLKLPDNQNSLDVKTELIKVTLSSKLIGTYVWESFIVRAEGEISDQSQQLYVVAQINNPYDDKSKEALKMGQYVTAVIQGKTIDNAIRIPSHCIYQGSYVYVEKKGVIKRQEVTLLWQNDKDVLVAQGLNEGDNLVLTPLGRVLSGTAVKVKHNSVQKPR